MDLAFVRSRSRRDTRRLLSAGFTLIELLVVCAIIIVVTGLILIDNNKFGGEVILENLAYDVALSVRQAQVYGIAVNRFGSNTFTAGYGIHFASASPSTYVLFADLKGNGMYDPSYSPSELVQTINLTQGYAITNLCATPASSNTETCGLSSLDILFKRPEPDAYISQNGISAITSPAALQQEARILLISPKGQIVPVEVDATGQISVQSQQ